MSNRIVSVKRYCQIQIEMLKDREKRLRMEIFDGKMQMEYLEGLMNDIDHTKPIEDLPRKKKIYLAPKDGSDA